MQRIQGLGLSNIGNVLLTQLSETRPNEPPKWNTVGTTLNTAQSLLSLEGTKEGSVSLWYRIFSYFSGRSRSGH